MTNPRLIGVDGPRKGQTFALTGERVDIGREPTNLLCVVDPSISRRHCSIRKRASGEFVLTDLNSRNGTFVNGLPVGERILEHGDEIQLGNCLFVFLVEAEETLRPAAARAGDSVIQTRTLIQPRRQETICLRPGEVLDTPATPARTTRNLKTLFKLSTTIRATRGVESLAQQLMELIFETVPAEHGAILLFGEDPGEPDWSFGWDRVAGRHGAVPVPDVLVRRAFHEGIAILSNDISDEGDTVDEAICSALAVPLAGFEGTLGIVYLCSTDLRVRFDEEHLQLATAIACVAGMAFENARHVEKLEAENRRLQEEINIEHDMVGESPRMQEVYRFIAKVAPSDSTVLIFGESGTGKELVARAVHRNSPRAGRPFVAINCAALTETLLESELFGHEKGSFTGAIAQKRGKLEMADGGTVFLDEVGELSPMLQAKLLRALQEREFERVGGTRSIRVDVRVIGATNRDLRADIAEGRFRHDLYYRLNVVSLTMPTLCERREDIPLLATYFAVKYGKLAKRKLVGLSPAARACLLEYDWPGNVRELENAIERAVVLGGSDQILPEDLPEVVLEAASPAFAPAGRYHDAVREHKRQQILKAIAQAGGSQTQAARILGVNPTYLSRLIRNLNLKSDIKKA